MVNSCLSSILQPGFPVWWWGRWWPRSQHNLSTAGHSSPQAEVSLFSPPVTHPAPSSGSSVNNKFTVQPSINQSIPRIPQTCQVRKNRHGYDCTLTRWAMRAGDWKTIHSSTAMVSWSLSFCMLISPPKNSSENGDTSVQSYKKIWNGWFDSNNKPNFQLWCVQSSETLTKIAKGDCHAYISTMHVLKHILLHAEAWAGLRCNAFH